MANSPTEEDLVVVRMVMEEGPDMVTLVTRVIVVLLLAVIFVVASVLNTVFLVIFYRRPSLRSISNRFIVSLTVVNLVTGWVVLPLVAVDVFLPQSALDLWEATVLCRTLDVTAEFVSSLAIFATLMIAVDRFCAITNPLHYHMLVTYSKMCIMIAGTWLSAAVVAAAAAPGGNAGRPWNICHRSNSSHMEEESDFDFQGKELWSYRSYYVICNMVISFAIPMNLILWIYFRIYRAAEENSERTRRNSLCGSSHDAVGTGRGSFKGPSRTPSTRSTSSQMVTNLRRRLSNASLFLHKEESRAAKISVIVIAMFFVCWLPCYCCTLVHSGLVKLEIPEVVHYAVMILALSNSAVSPYIYLYRSRRIQREVRRLFGLSLKSSVGGSRGFNSAKRLVMRLPLEMIPPSPTVVLDGNFDLDTTAIQLYHNMPPPIQVSPLTTIINKFFRLNSIQSESWEGVITPISSSSSNTNSNSIYTSSSSSSSAATGSPVEESESMLPHMINGNLQPDL